MKTIEKIKNIELGINIIKGECFDFLDFTCFFNILASNM